LSENFSAEIEFQDIDPMYIGVGWCQLRLRPTGVETVSWRQRARGEKANKSATFVFNIVFNLFLPAKFGEIMWRFAQNTDSSRKK
jgi:hypothetical protein